MSKQWAPSTVLSTGIAVGLALFLLALYFATGVPRLGITTVPGQEGARIVDVDPEGPLARILKPGDELIAVRSETREMALEPFDAIAEPDDAATYGPYNRFFERQDHLWTTLQSDRVSFGFKAAESIPGSDTQALVQQTDWVTVNLTTDVSPTDLSPEFWYQVICGLLIFWMGVAAWAFVQNERGPFFYALAGFGIAVAIIASAVYTTRELSLPADLLLALSRSNQFGAMLFAGAGTTLLWHYPTSLSHFRFEWLMLPLVALILAANWGQWIDSLDITARYTLLAWALTDVILAVVQWRRTRREPVARARLKWFVYSWFGGIISYLSLVVVPQVIGYPSLIHQKYAWILFVFSYLGIALGIVRYRLFDLDRWILVAWFWFLCGILVIVIDGLLVLWLDLQYSMSLVVSLALVGWVYFPLRQMLLRRFLPSSAREDQWEQLPTMISDAFEVGGSIDRQWQKALHRSFSPLQTRRLEHGCTTPAVLDNGLKLRTPLLGESACLEMSYANQGHRLFDHQDTQFAARAMELFRFARQYRDSFEDGIKTERERVARDLHDDVGARLLSIIYRANDTELSGLARECLRELRGVIQGLQKQIVPLDQSFSRWHIEAGERCQLFGIDLDMTLAPDAAIITLTPRVERNLMSIIREFLSNTIRHARATDVRLHIRYQDSCLILDASDNGIGWGTELTANASGIGLHSIRERCEELYGDMRYYCPLNSGAGMICTLPAPGAPQS
ncbi:ATP-binding protein [Marinobacter sp. GN3S48]|uniref:ATP-binding protein n=1 Tax=Marinobacter sp. GN3S48 TaxID=3382302 RepID=UPI00387A8862